MSALRTEIAGFLAVCSGSPEREPPFILQTGHSCGRIMRFAAGSHLIRDGDACCGFSPGIIGFVRFEREGLECIILIVTGKGLLWYFQHYRYSVPVSYCGKFCCWIIVRSAESSLVVPDRMISRSELINRSYICLPVRGFGRLRFQNRNPEPFVSGKNPL